MIVENPEVTLEDEGHGFPEGARDTAQMEWSLFATAHGDDGRQYWIDASEVSSGDTWGIPNMWIMGINWGKGKVVQSQNTIYKVADFPQGNAVWDCYMRDDLSIKRSENEVAIDLGDYHLRCKNDKTWHFNLENKELAQKIEVVHTGIGLPYWYGKEKPSVCTPHTISYGYVWPGRIEGTITVEGREVKIKGKSARQRWWSPDVCLAEMGGWMELLWFHFDEMFASMADIKLSGWRDMSLYMVDEKQYFPAGNFTIEHHNWAWLQPLGAFIPTYYQVTIETEAGVLEMSADVVGYHMWGATGTVPDNPILALRWDRDAINGTFTYKDGRKKTLTNGLGASIIREWKPYPSIIIPGIEASSQSILDLTIV